MDVLRKTPFWYFIYTICNLPAADIKRFKKYDPCISDILRSSNLHERVTPRGFNIGGKVLLPKRMDVEVLFGIRDGDLPIETSNRTIEENDFIARCFPLKIAHIRGKGRGSYSLTKSIILKALVLKIEAPDDDAIVVSDVARLVHLYLLSNFFLASKNYLINWHLTKCVLDLDNICMYDWTRLILRTILKGVQNSHANLSKTCTLFLQVSDFRATYSKI